MAVVGLEFFFLCCRSNSYSLSLWLSVCVCECVCVYAYVYHRKNYYDVYSRVFITTHGKKIVDGIIHIDTINGAAYIHVVQCCTNRINETHTIKCAAIRHSTFHTKNHAHTTERPIDDLCACEWDSICYHQSLHIGVQLTLQ